MNIKLERLCKKLNYTFGNVSYLKQALTHRSFGDKNYERLEFLGDSILSFTIAHALFQSFPNQSEGQLSQVRSFLVKGETLAEIARDICLGDYLFLGQGELKSGGFCRASTLADSLEAVFAAIYLDGGIEAAKEVILGLYSTRLLDPNLYEHIKDAKTQLQEYLQAAKLTLPEYCLTQITGSEHNQFFYTQCTVEGIEYTAYGKGTTRRKAEQLAARALLQYLIQNKRL